MWACKNGKQSPKCCGVPLPSPLGQVGRAVCLTTVSVMLKAVKAVARQQTELTYLGLWLGSVLHGSFCFPEFLWDATVTLPKVGMGQGGWFFFGEYLLHD